MSITTKESDNNNIKNEENFIKTNLQIFDENENDKKNGLINKKVVFGVYFCGVEITTVVFLKLVCKLQ